MFSKKKIGILLLIMMFVNFFTTNVQAEGYTYSNNAIGNVDIISTPDVSLESVKEWARGKNATETFISLAELYQKYSGERGGVNWVLAYVQAAKETGYGRFGGVLDESFKNPCGLKNSLGGEDYDADAHKKFDTWEQGVIAHLDHLALYAGAYGYPKTEYVPSWQKQPLSENQTYDPRHTGWYSSNAVFGQAKDAISLGGRWAPSSTYGVEVFRLYCEATNSNYLPARSYLDMPSSGAIISDGKLTIKGWALHAFGIKEVRVLINGVQIDKLDVNVSRDDVDKAYPGYFNGNISGFYKEISLDLNSIGSGIKNLQLNIIANDGSIQTIEKSITISNRNLQNKSCLDTPKNNEVVKTNSISIRGWALNSLGVKEVRVSIDGKDLGTVPYGTLRDDVNSVYPGYPSGDNAGFDGIIDISSISNGAKKIDVKITGNDGSQQVIERTIKVEKLQSRSYLDNPKNNDTVKGNELDIRGWALDITGIKEVRVSIDGKDLGSVPYGTSRSDVNKAYPGYPSGDNAGFDGTIDISSVQNGTKNVVVTIIANSGSTQIVERTIKVERLISRSNLDNPINNFSVKGNELNIRGWALDPAGIKEIRVGIDGKDLGTVPYGTLRSDVNKAYPGYPSGDNAGFDGTIDISSVANGTRKVSVTIISNSGAQQIIQKTIKIDKLVSRNYLDTPNNNQVINSNEICIKGWALDITRIKEVRVSIDGKDLGTVPYGTLRDDVNKVYPGYPSGNNSGFEGKINIANISDGTKKLVVTITANNGTKQVVEKTILIKRLPKKSCLDTPSTNEVIKTSSLNIRGWALDSSGIKEVRVFVDGNDLGTIPYGTLRSDVNKAYPGYPSGDNAGFDGTIDLSSLSSGNKKVTVKITANDGSIQNIERYFVYKKTTVVVDPGHENPGGDPGASAIHNGITYIESNLNLQIAVRLKAQLEARGIEVYMTRYEGSGQIATDSSESLKKRVQVANEMNADFFVSIHHNSFTSSSANGLEVYYSTGTPISTTSISKSGITEDGKDLTLESTSYGSRSTTEKVQISKKVATEIVNEASTELKMYNRGAKDSVYYVCKNTTMPSILIENGFLTNPSEAAKVSTPVHQQKLAEITAKVITNTIK